MKKGFRLFLVFLSSLLIPTSQPKANWWNTPRLKLGVGAFGGFNVGTMLEGDLNHSGFSAGQGERTASSGNSMGIYLALLSRTSTFRHTFGIEKFYLSNTFKNEPYTLWGSSNLERDIYSANIDVYIPMYRFEAFFPTFNMGNQRFDFGIGTGTSFYWWGSGEGEKKEAFEGPEAGTWEENPEPEIEYRFLPRGTLRSVFVANSLSLRMLNKKPPLEIILRYELFWVGVLRIDEESGSGGQYSQEQAIGFFIEHGPQLVATFYF